eukprot:9464711-Ditylum_brightwellii.AAC.1
MWIIKQQHSQVKEVFVQSNNALVYQYSGLLYSFYHAAVNYEIAIHGAVYPATQCGKDLVDAHFSVGMKQAIKLLSRGNGIGNEKQLVWAFRLN